MSKEFFDLFQNKEDYPDNLAERGVEQNYLYGYVPTDFINGFINHVSPFFVCVVERYEDWEKSNLEETWVETAKKKNPDYSNIDDDIILLGETENSIWFFWADEDVSDNLIGRFDKSIWNLSKKEIIEQLKEYLVSIGRVGNLREKGHTVITGKCLELPLPDGWINF